MNKKKIIILIVLLIVIIIGIRLFLNKKDKSKTDISYISNIDMDTLKTDKGISVSNDIIEIVEEYDGRKSIAIKGQYLFEIGLIDYYQKNYDNLNIVENTDITSTELEQSFKIAKDAIIVNNGGVIIPPKDQQSILQIINKNSTCDYWCDENNYLKISEEEKKSEFDNKLIEKINSNSNTIIITYEKDYLSIDEVTGQIVKYPYYDLDPYCEYDVVKNDNIEIRFVNPEIKNLNFLVN